VADEVHEGKRRRRTESSDCLFAQ